jgi:hypothetical protein
LPGAAPVAHGQFETLCIHLLHVQWPSLYQKAELVEAQGYRIPKDFEPFCAFTGDANVLVDLINITD